MFVVLGFALALEAIYLVHVVRLVVSTVEEELIRSQPLVCIQEKSDLRRPGTAVDEISVEQIGMGIGWETIQSENLEEVEVLA